MCHCLSHWPNPASFCGQDLPIPDLLTALMLFSQWWNLQSRLSWPIIFAEPDQLIDHIYIRQILHNLKAFMQVKSISVYLALVWTCHRSPQSVRRSVTLQWMQIIWASVSLTCGALDSNMCPLYNVEIVEIHSWSTEVSHCSECR